MHRILRPALSRRLVAACAALLLAAMPAAAASAEADAAAADAAPDASAVDASEDDASAQLTRAYQRALLLGRVFGSQGLTSAAADAVTATVVTDDQLVADVAGPPQQTPPSADAEAPTNGPAANTTGADRGGSEGGEGGEGPDVEASPHAGILGTPPPREQLVESTPSAGFEMEASDDTPEGYQPRGGSGSTGSARSGWVCPVPEWTWFTHDWGFPRSGGRTHKGNDIFAPEGSPLLAVASGVVVKTSPVERGLGGIIVSYLTDSGLVIYNAHMHSIAPGIAPGTRVIPGQQIGTVGRTGNARTTPPHLHIGVYPASGGVIDPYPYTSVACR